MAQTCRPERTRNLPNRDLDLRHVEFALQSRLDFASRGAGEKQIQRFPQVIARLLDRVALAGDIRFRTKGNLSRPFAFDDRGQSHG